MDTQTREELAQWWRAVRWFLLAGVAATLLVFLVVWSAASVFGW